ncbi:hypothetical protein FB645_000616 [Coemansia sp. IMI 203386]|nr:hypothetical protein FB645_000616 [Coemansia sp. IMI 203386]
MNPLPACSRLCLTSISSSSASLVRSKTPSPAHVLLTSCHRNLRSCYFGTKTCAKASVCSTVPDCSADLVNNSSSSKELDKDRISSGLCGLSKKPFCKTESKGTLDTHSSSAQQNKITPAKVASTLKLVDIKKPGQEKTFYRRELPEGLVSFTSPQGRKLFKESLNEGYAEGYFNLAGNFTVQSEPAYCGPSSLAMVLNALEVDPGRKWKGVWRWYSDELLKSCRAESDLKANGITYDEFLCLGSTHAQVIAKRGKSASREEFLRDIKYVTQRDDVFMVVSFYRPALNQTGDGHFSPVGAYHPGTNQVLVLDSARYKYPSWFCDVDRLYDALQQKDVETGLPRGYFLIARRDARVDPCLFSSSESQETYYSQLGKDSDTESSSEVVDLPERPSDVLPTRISCGKSTLCCSSKRTLLHG